MDFINKITKKYFEFLSERQSLGNFSVAMSK